MRLLPLLPSSFMLVNFPSKVRRGLIIVGYFNCINCCIATSNCYFACDTSRLVSMHIRSQLSRAAGAAEDVSPCRDRMLCMRTVLRTSIIPLTSFAKQKRSQSQAVLPFFFTHDCCCRWETTTPAQLSPHFLGTLKIVRGSQHQRVMATKAQTTTHRKPAREPPLRGLSTTRNVPGIGRGVIR